MELSPGELSAANQEGVSFGVQKPGVSSTNPSTGFTYLMMKLSSAKSGLVYSTGTITITSTATTMPVTLTNLKYIYDPRPDVPEETGSVTAVVNGLTGQYESLNGTRQEVFSTLDDEQTTTWGKVKKTSSGYKRVGTTKISTALITPSGPGATVDTAIDATLQTSFFSADPYGDLFAGLQTVKQSRYTCSTKVKCDRLG